MTKQKTTWLTGAWVVALAIACFAKVPTITGKMVAYDPLLHAAKDATFSANNRDRDSGSCGIENQVCEGCVRRFWDDAN